MFLNPEMAIQTPDAHCVIRHTAGKYSRVNEALEYNIKFSVVSEISRVCGVLIRKYLFLMKNFNTIYPTHLQKLSSLGDRFSITKVTSHPLYRTNAHLYSISQEICTRFYCALLCCGYAIVHNEFTWSINPYSSGLLCWHWGNR